MPYLCMIRTDIDDGTLFIQDLWPRTSQRNLIYDPPGQTKYVNRVGNDTVVTQTVGSAIQTAREFKGLAAYLIDHVEAGGLAAGTAALTAAQANTIAAAIVAAMDAGSASTLAALNALLSATVANTELTNAGGSESTGSLTEVLAILGGHEYTVPAGSEVDSDGSTFQSTVSGSFTSDYYRQTYDSGALQISLGEGELGEYIAAGFTYQGTAGAALVVYDDDGSVMS